jgi:hypothetical protein
MLAIFMEIPLLFSRLQNVTSSLTLLLKRQFLCQEFDSFVMRFHRAIVSPGRGKAFRAVLVGRAGMPFFLVVGEC